MRFRKYRRWPALWQYAAVGDVRTHWPKWMGTTVCIAPCLNIQYHQQTSILVPRGRWSWGVDLRNARGTTWDYQTVRFGTNLDWGLNVRFKVERLEYNSFVWTASFELFYQTLIIFRENSISVPYSANQPYGRMPWEVANEIYLEPYPNQDSLNMVVFFPVSRPNKWEDSKSPS